MWFRRYKSTIRKCYIATQESPGLTTFSMNLDDEEDRMGGSLSKKPIGV